MKNAVNRVKSVVKRIFDNRNTRFAGVIFILIIATSVFNSFSGLPEKYPLLGVFSFLMVPILFIAGAVIFVIAILKT